MSIFKSTLDPTIAAQLKARESVVSQWGDSKEVDAKGNPIYKAGVAPRDSKFLRYVAGKNAWVKLSSFVNYNSKVFKNGKWADDGRYKGDQLAKKYVLEGGTLFNNKDLRSGAGINQSGTAYGSDIDRISANGNVVDRLYGIRPMPGIESANIINISAYGSLREATVTFYAWDRHQLEELEILYMRPGYTCLLEWGWSQYLNHSVANNVNKVPDNITIENFSTGIDAFKNYTEDAIYEEIDKLIDKYRGNYDAMLGYVKNFSWQLMPNGGYQCSTTLISRGEVLETIKASSNPNVIIGSKTQNAQIITSVNDAEQKPSLSYFENIFLNLIGYINDSEITAKQGQLNVNAQSTNTNADGTPANMTPATNTAQQQQIRDIVKSVGDDIIARVSKTNLKRYNVDKISDVTGFNIKNEGFFIKPIDGGTNGSAIEYITLDSFIAILNTFFIYKTEKTYDNLIDIVLPYKTPFLISEDTVSIDPTTCLINNPKATFVTSKTDGFNPEVYYMWNVDSSNGNISYIGANMPSIILGSNSKTNIGALGNVCISVQKCIDIYRQLYGSGDGVSIIDLLKEVMENVNLALGGINNFTIYTSKNTVQIIDAQYLESKTDPNGSKNDKFVFDLIGLKSICRDVKINSRIFSEQSTMMAIGAASSGYNNVGDIYSSTQTAFNRGLEDRVIGKLQYDTSKPTEKIVVNGTEYSGSVVYYYNIAANILSLTNYVNYKVLGTNTFQGKTTPFKITHLPQENEIINAASLLKTTHYQINGKDVDFKALIPFELEITLDGISGFVTGQIFRIDRSILPKDYHNKNIGFIITKQSHSLRGNDWVTNISTQVCLLDNDDLPYEGVNKDQLKKIITSIIGGLKAASYLKYAMADYLVYLTYHLLATKEKLPIDPKNVTYDRIANIFNGIGSNILDFDAYLRNWVRSFQVKEDIGFVSPYYNPSYRKGLKPVSETELLSYFPKTVSDIAVVVNPSDGTKVTFNSAYFKQFIFDKEKSAKDKKNIEDTKNEITENERKKFEESLERGNVAESTQARTITGKTLPESVKIDLDAKSKTIEKAKSFLSIPQIKFTVNGSEFTLDPIIPGASLPEFFEKQIATKAAPSESQQVDATGKINDVVYTGESKYIDVKALWAFYLNYLENTYFDKTTQTVFKGGGTSPISIFWGTDDPDNLSYYTSKWYQKQFVTKVKSGLK